MWRENSHYCYTPYELADPTGDAVQNLLDTQKIGDCGILNGEIRGEKNVYLSGVSGTDHKISVLYGSASGHGASGCCGGKDYQKAGKSIIMHLPMTIIWICRIRCRENVLPSLEAMREKTGKSMRIMRKQNRTSCIF